MKGWDIISKKLTQQDINSLIGLKVGRLLITRYIGCYEVGKSGVKHWYKCECDCGNKDYIVVRSILLKAIRDKSSISCGCLHREKLTERNKKINTYDLSGEYGIGYTFKGEKFYFDLEDYDKIKDYCWYINRDGYVVVSKYNIRMHRLVMNCPDDMDVDHIYHNNFDSRKEFLRIVTKSQNQWNRGLNFNNTSGVTGVYWQNQNEKWYAQIMVKNKSIYLGTFDDFDEAVQARKDAEIKYFGEYRFKEK